METSYTVWAHFTYLKIHRSSSPPPPPPVWYVQVQKEMRETFEKMMERLETQYENKQHRLVETQQKLKGQAVQLTRATRDLENKVSCVHYSVIKSTVDC